MNKDWLRVVTAALFLLTVPVTGSAQDAGQTQGQLEQMLAPIALYPDPLLAQILMASTYPQEIVQAENWVQDPQNASLRGDQLAAAVDQQAWDPSVKSLVPFPQILQMMNNNLQWTEQLGDSFLSEQGAVMDTVQQMRQQARAAGTLQTTQQQVVTADGQDIEILPANPQEVYVPYYNPQSVYGTWAYPSYPPYYFPPAPGYVDTNVGLLGFGVGIAIIAPLWGWDHWDWHHHHIAIDNSRFSRINNGRPPVSSGVWQHNPDHRHGVPYHSPVARAQFHNVPAEQQRSYRGYEASAPAVNREPATQVVHPVAAPVRQPHLAPAIQPAPRQEAVRAVRPAPMIERRPPPVFESLSRGADVRAAAARGAASRAGGGARVQQGGGRGERKH